MDGRHPLRYVDVDDPGLAEYPALATALSGGESLPLVLVGDEVKSPPAISVYWMEDQLAKLDHAAAVCDGGRGN
jgi:hypothetical protein